MHNIKRSVIPQHLHTVEAAKVIDGVYESVGACRAVPTELTDGAFGTAGFRVYHRAQGCI